MKIEKERKPNCFTMLRLMMWKNFLLAWRHRWQTFVEMLLPIFFTSMILLLRWQTVELSVQKPVVYPAMPAQTLKYSTDILASINTTQITIAYSPTSPVLEDVITSAVTNLIFDNLPYLPGIKMPTDVEGDTTAMYNFLRNLVKVDSYNSSDEMRDLYSNEKITHKTLAAIQFDDELYGATELSNNLSYSIWFPEKPRQNSFNKIGRHFWRSQEVLNHDKQIPRLKTSSETESGYANAMFIALQHVISTDLISRATGEDLKSFSVDVQWFATYRERSLNSLQFFLPAFIMLGFIFSTVNFVRAIAREKELQLKEIMKMAGLPTWLHWTGWFCKQFIHLLLIATIMVILLKIKWFSDVDGLCKYAVFTKTHWTVLLFFLMLYLTSSIFFGFLTSIIFSKSTIAAITMGMFWWLGYIPGILLLSGINVSILLQMLSCLSFNTAMNYGFKLLLHKERHGGMQWDDVFETTCNGTFVAFGDVVIMLTIDCLLYLMAALYLEQVLPNPYRTSKPWHFPFQGRFWCRRKSESAFILQHEKEDFEDIVKEKDPVYLPVGIEIKNLTKAYQDFIAVDQLSLNVYNDQLTVLLGNAGAGKTTIMSMLTGNVAMTDGTVNVAGFDMRTQAAIARKHISFCPQRNVLFDDLTVGEHLDFFARLKGFSGNKLKAEIDALTEKLHLKEKRNLRPEELSVGEKRRLCVAIALSGAASVVLLDDPTFCMDAASRKNIWDYLQEAKRGRTIILTTQYRDDACAFGDRVAIISSGRLRCVGSPHFLKQQYGVGYTLVVVKDLDFDYNEFSLLINKYIPGAIINEHRGSEVTYTFPHYYSHVFACMLDDLEKNINIIKFKSYSVIVTTLEDVFKSVAAGKPQSETEDIVVKGLDSKDMLNNNITPYLEQMDREGNSTTGVFLWCMQALAVWMKLTLLLSRSYKHTLILLAAPTIVINALLLTLGMTEYFASNKHQLLPLTDEYRDTVTLLSFNGSSSTSLGALTATAYQTLLESSGIRETDSQPVSQHYLDETMLDRLTFNDNSVTAWFSNFGNDDIATSLAAIYSALLKAKNSTAVLNVHNYPLEAQNNDRNQVEMKQMQASLFATAFGISIMIINVAFVRFYVKETISYKKLLQRVAGLHPMTLWFSTFFFDMILFMIICIPIVVTTVAYDVIGLSTGEGLGLMVASIALYACVALPLTYHLSAILKDIWLSVIVVLAMSVFGLTGAQLMDTLTNIYPDENLSNLNFVFHVVPLYRLVTVIREMSGIGIINSQCYSSCDYWQLLQPGLQCTMQDLCQFDTICCINDTPYLSVFKEYVVGLLQSNMFLWPSVFIVEYRFLQKFICKCKSPPPVEESTLDDDVISEAEATRLVPVTNRSAHAVLATDITKYYKKNLAVNQVSFSVKDGECFGLLGMNSAGKSTTLRMLLGEEFICKGEAYVSGRRVQSKFSIKVNKNIGFCPQINALFEEMTGRETLRMFSLLRGLRKRVVKPVIETLSYELGFAQDLDKRVAQYSTSKKRALSMAIALLGPARLLVVDEPTAGVDPATKRNLVRAVRSAQRAGRGVVLASQSLAECEALCSKLTIMVNGQFRCIGSPQHLRDKFCKGFKLTINLKTDIKMGNSERIKHYIESNFENADIMEEYPHLLVYHLPYTGISWADIFTILEGAKQEFNFEDYTISQTTLEQLFIKYTKEQKHE